MADKITQCNHLKEALSCMICVEYFDIPYTLECGHSYCEVCLHQWLLKNKSCPQCRHTVSRKPFPSYTLQNIANAYKSLIGKEVVQVTANVKLWDELFPNHNPRGYFGDREDNVLRCASCFHELEPDGECILCNLQYHVDDNDNEDDNDSDEDGDDSDDSDQMQVEDQYESEEDYSQSDLDFIVSDDQVEYDSDHDTFDDDDNDTDNDFSDNNNMTETHDIYSSASESSIFSDDDESISGLQALAYGDDMGLDSSDHPDVSDVDSVDATRVISESDFGDSDNITEDVKQDSSVRSGLSPTAIDPDCGTSKNASDRVLQPDHDDHNDTVNFLSVPKKKRKPIILDTDDEEDKDEDPHHLTPLVSTNGINKSGSGEDSLTLDKDTATTTTAVNNNSDRPIKDEVDASKNKKNKKRNKKKRNKQNRQQKEKEISHQAKRVKADGATLQGNQIEKMATISQQPEQGSIKDGKAKSKGKEKTQSSPTPAVITKDEDTKSQDEKKKRKRSKSKHKHKENKKKSKTGPSPSGHQQ